MTPNGSLNIQEKTKGINKNLPENGEHRASGLSKSWRSKLIYRITAKISCLKQKLLGPVAGINFEGVFLMNLWRRSVASLRFTTLWGKTQGGFHTFVDFILWNPFRFLL